MARRTSIRIRGPVNEGQIIAKPFVGGPPRPKRAKFFNPDGEVFERVTSLEWGRRLIAQGVVTEVMPGDEQEVDPPPKYTGPDRLRGGRVNPNPKPVKKRPAKKGKE